MAKWDYRGLSIVFVVILLAADGLPQAKEGTGISSPAKQIDIRDKNLISPKSLPKERPVFRIPEKNVLNVLKDWAGRFGLIKRSPGCGGGTVDGEEQCDDGNLFSGDGCSCTCFNEPVPPGNCGNGVCEIGESNVDSDGESLADYPTYCLRDCMGTVEAPSVAPYTVACGNCIVDGIWEECDDGNTTSGDGCSAECAIEPPVCGDGVIETGETCDDGNTASGDGCTDFCRLENPPAILCYGCDAFLHCTSVSSNPYTCEYFFDNPSCDESCTFRETPVDPEEPDVELCSTPDPADLPPQSRYRDYPTSRHISICEDEDRVRYIICGAAGGITVNLIPCPSEHRCINGACTFVPEGSEAGCLDSDPENDVRVRGAVAGITERGESYGNSDSCMSLERTVEQTCNADGTLGSVIYSYCPEGEECREGVCGAVVRCTPTCLDTDPENNPDVQGEVSGMNRGCSLYSLTDACGGQVDCNPDGTYTTSGSEVICPERYSCEDGRCIETPTCTPTCTDSDPTNNVHILGTVSGILANCEGFVSEDSCLGFDAVMEQTCGADESPSPIIRDCPPGEHCSDSICGEGGEVCTCSRTSATATAGGFVTESDCTVQHDICDSGTLVRYTCGASGSAAEMDRITCPSGCADGLCR